MKSRLVYTTRDDDQTVTIDYNQGRCLFLTDKEYHPFSAERIVQMLNYWAKIKRIDITLGGWLHITTGDGTHCVITKLALRTLSFLYQQRPDWQIDYPFVSEALACGSTAS